MISFYLPYDEVEALRESGGSEAEALYKKIVAAWDELEKQLWPLAFFTGGAAVGIYVASHINFWSLVIPESIVIILMLEIMYKNYIDPTPVTSDTSTSHTQSSMPDYEI